MTTAQVGEAGFGDTMTPQQIYDNFMNAEGPGDLMRSQHHLATVMSAYQERVDRITTLVAAMEEGWTGSASQAAQLSAGPLALAHDEAAMCMVEASQLIQNQIQAFYDTKNKVVPIPEVPRAPSTLENLIILGAENCGYQDKVKASFDAAQQNVSAMDSWSVSSSDNGFRMPSAYGNLGHAGLPEGRSGMAGTGIPGHGGNQPPETPPLGVAGF
ncbi:PPE domain-containing protein [Amycolatopsis pigmentata]|uniref:PPE domain-containing protein n=1 Tax=Amycolatopsis pigmentata TaxID=450801 RepID=A0ABW5FX66_9PSEU